MNDLISRSGLIKVLKDRATNEAIMGYMTAYDVTNSIIDEVEEQPTAYSVDKVVEELEKLQDKAVSVKNEDISMYATGMMGKAIEIAKQGGVSDDVCEWKYNNSEYYWESSCDHLHIFMSDGPEENEYKFCPYCGKKILCKE